MSLTIRLEEMRQETNYAPLGVVGYCLNQSKFLEPIWQRIELELKTVEHEPRAKLQDVLVSILSGCRAISQVNTRLRPELALAQAWGRRRFADQSMLARTLDACGPSQVERMRQGSAQLLRQHSAVFAHNFEQEWLYLDVDLTPLPISKKAQDSTKGKFEKKTVMGVSSLGSMRLSIMRPYSRRFIQASKTVGQPTFRCSKP